MNHPSLLRRILFILALAAASSSQAFTWEDFETGDTSWSTRIFAASLLSDGTLSDDFASSGTHSYRGRFKIPKGGGRLAVSTRQGGDMTGLTAFTFDVYNSSPLALEGFLVFKTGPAWTWAESSKFQLRSGWNKNVTVLVNSATPPAGASAIKIDELRDAREVNLVFDSKEAGEGFLYLDNIGLTGADPAKFAVSPEASKVTGAAVLVAGFEGSGSLFLADTYSGSSATGVEMVSVKTTEGARAGRFTYDSKVPDEKPSYTLEAELDLSAVSGVKVDVFNPLADEADMVFTVNTGADWEYYESILRTLKPGWNTDVSFSLHAKTYKCESSGWVNSVRIANLRNTRKMSLAFLPHIVGPSYFLVDNLRLVAADEKKLVSMIRASGAVEAPPLTGVDKLIEGFEGETVWAAAAGTSAAVSHSVAEMKTSEGRRALKCDFEVVGTQKSAFFGVEGDLNLSGVQAVKVDVYNPAQAPLQAMLAFNIGDRWLWMESKGVDLKPGWNMDVTIPLNTPSFKSEATRWSFKAKPGPLSKVRKMYVGFFSNQPIKGSVFLDNVRFNAEAGYKLKTAKTKARRVVQGREVVFDPLQSAAGGWQADPSATNNSFSVAVHYEKKDGASAVKLKYRTATDTQKGSFYLDGAYDWTSVTGFRFDLFNPMDHPLEGSLALKSGPDYKWHETARFSIKPGWNRDLTVEVDGPSWKTQESNWTNTDTLKFADDVRQINLLIYPNRAEQGHVFLARVRTVERDLFGSLGQKSLGRLLGVSSKTVLAGWADGSVGVFGAETGVAVPPIAMSGLYATEGKHSVRIPFILRNDSADEYVIKLSGDARDLRSVDAIQVDLYNPGPPITPSVAFKNTTDQTWVESAAAYTLATGWNRNWTLPLDGPNFKSMSTAWKSGETLSLNDLRAQVDEIHIKISGRPGLGSLYIDNLRYVSNDRKKETGGVVTQNLLFKVNPNDTVQMMLGGTVWKGDTGPAGADFSQAQLDIRGGGQEFRASAGSVIAGTDDPMKLLDGSRLGPSVLAISEKATVMGASLRLLGFARNLDRPFKLGSGAGWSARLTQVLLEDYTVGIGVIGHRFGNEPGSNPFSADIESDIKTYQADLKGYVKRISLNFEAEIAQSAYDEYLSSSYGNPDTNKNAHRLSATWSEGPLKLTAARLQKESGFFSPYSKESSFGFYQNNAEVGYQLDTLGPLKALRRKGGFLGDLVENLKTYTQYYDWHVRADTYENYGIRTVLETNDYKSRLYVKSWWYWFKEGKDAGDPTLDNPTLSTREMQFTWNVEARYRLKPNLFLNALGRQGSTHHWEQNTGSCGLKFRFWGDTWINGDLKHVRMLGDRTGEYTNGNAELVKRMKGSCYEIKVSYGLPSFNGYWMDDTTLNTLDRWNVSFTGRF